MSAVILWQLGPLSFEYVIPDATISEEHSESNEIPKHPVEQGFAIADHVISQPAKISIEGELTNHPLEYLASLRNPSDRAEQIYEKLMSLKENSYLATIITSIREYENMLLKSMSVPRNAQAGSNVYVKLSFEEVSIAESAIVDAPEPKVERAKPKKPDGKKGKKKPSRQVESLLSKIGRGLGVVN